MSITTLLKQLRGVPAVNAPLTHGTRAIMHALGRESEFAIKHLPHVGTTTMSLPDGRTARLWSRGDDWVSNQVFWRGCCGYEGDVTPLFWSLAARAGVTFDIGAHVGFYTVLAAAANPRAVVCAFEPLAVVFERLERNISLNKLDNVIMRNEAVGNVNGEAEFFHVPGIVPCSSSLSRTFMRGTLGLASTRVRVIRLDAFVADNRLATIDLMKLDTETTEPDVLAGMGRLLDDYRPDIICEVLPRGDADGLTAILQPLGYSFYLLTDSGPIRRDRVIGDERWSNYFFSSGVERQLRT
jgi:FkbM family methyltransferase